MNSQAITESFNNRPKLALIPRLSVIAGGNNAAATSELTSTEAKKDTAASPATCTDAELILQCQQKNPRAFEELLKRHQRTVYALLYRLAPDWSDPSDLAQEVFIRMWRSIGHLRNPNAFRSWVSQIVTNLFYDELRKRPRQLKTISMDEPLDSEDGNDATTRDIRDKSAGPDELCQRKELRKVVREAMTQLPEQFQTAIILREFEGLSYEEISVITKTEIGTVKSRIARARAKVQEIISPYVDAA